MRSKCHNRIHVFVQRPAVASCKAKPRSRGFTLVELLVVMAISAILVGLVMYPVYQTFVLTRRAQAMVDAQDAARQAMTLINRELGQAMYIYDNSATPINLPVRQAGGSVQNLELPYAKIDFVLPKVTMHCNNPDHDESEPRDYPRGREAWPPCPVCGERENLEMRPKLPIEQDVTVVRYFLGLRYNDPNAPNYGWRSPWKGTVEVGEENQVVLYRVEFEASDNDLFPSDMSDLDRISDPNFFYRQGYSEAWANRVRVIGVAKYEDLVEAVYDSAGNVTSIEPTVTFRFASIENDTFSGAFASDKSFEYPSAVPSIYRATYGYWTPGSNVTVYRDNYETAYVLDPTGTEIRKWTKLDGYGAVVFKIDDYLNSRDVVGDTDDVEMAFTVDPNSGTVDFSLHPKWLPEQLTESDIEDINERYHNTYKVDRGRARRWALLSTFDSSSSNYRRYARIVPGSERVYGPDMTPGSPGGVVQYERVPIGLGDAGLNQYKIDYDTGYIYFSPVYDYDLPATGPITIDYKIQFNRKGDVVRGDYTTKSLVNVHLGMRMFDPESGKPYPMDLNSSVKVRNALR